MKALFDFISKLLAALSRAAGDKAEEPDAPTPEKCPLWTPRAPLPTAGAGLCPTATST